MQTPTGKRRRKDNRQRALLEGAARLFCARGYVQTSLRDIAAEVGMLAGSIYYHFTSKEDLLVAVHQAAAENIVSAIDTAIQDSEEPWRRLESASAAYLESILADHSFPTMVIRVLPRSDADLRARLVALREPYELIFHKLVDDLELPNQVDRNYFRLALLGSLTYAQTWYRPGGDSPARIANCLLGEFKSGKTMVV